MTAHNLSATTTDTFGASDTDTATINSTATAPMRTVTRSLLANRIQWGSAVDFSPRGPTFADVTPSFYTFYTPGDPITLAQIFTVEIPVTFTGCRIYKSPAAVGAAIPVKLWSGVTSGTELGSATMTWTADGGGWRQVSFTPVDLVPGVTYVVGYYSADAAYAYSEWVFNAQDTVVWPIVAKSLVEASGTRTHGNAVAFGTSSIAFPTSHTASNLYIDPQIQWGDPLPAYSGGTAYWDQWTTSYSRHAFPIAVFFSDPQYLADYYALGVNTLIGGSLNADYIDAMNTAGNTMDWWPYIGDAPTAELVQTLTDEPDVADQVVGWQLDDEPDMSSPYRSPALLRTRLNLVKQWDSTRPVYLGMGRWSILNQGFGWSPSGASPLVVNELWRDWGSLADLISCDLYSLSDSANPTGNWGVWVYAAQVGRMREITDDRIPVWITVETTSQTSGQPDPDDVRKAIWATLIAGARGVVLFDHRFGSDFVTQDFAAMLHDPAMSAMMSTLTAQLQTLGVALQAADLGLVTASTSSNTTAGPLGGTYGVPVHYTTRADSAHHYLFAQAIRPGATTATFTIPTWAGSTLTVLGESRTVAVSGGGVLTDTFTDHAVHLYQRTP